MGAGLSGTQPPWLAGHTFAPRLDPCAGVAEASKWTWRNRLTSGMWRWGVPQRYIRQRRPQSADQVRVAGPTLPTPSGGGLASGPRD